jgi:DNA-binding NtrC family response regulator
VWNILCVDDEEGVRNAVARRLGREGYTVTTADGELEGLDTIKSHNPPFDVVVTDMVMESPDSGVNILQAAVARDIFTEVIVLTAYGNVSNAVECMKRGAFDHVEKNIPGVDVFDLLVMKVQQALERRKASIDTIRRLDMFTKK